MKRNEGQSLTPMMQQYRELKEQHKEAILFFRLGDFYEMFFEDAIVASQELGLVLTSRESGENAPPMCGVPYHAADGYIARLVAKGYKVAICEQMEDPRLAKGLVRREVVRIITPGTITDDKVLPEKGNNFLAAVVPQGECYGLAWADVSTGEFHVKYCASFLELADELARLNPAECLLPSYWLGKTDIVKRLQTWYSGVFTPWDEGLEPDVGLQLLRERFGSQWQLEAKGEALAACSLLLSYLLATQKNTLPHLKPPSLVEDIAYMALDQATRRNLELFLAGREAGRRGSLLWVLDRTATAMGGRTLKRWLERPLVKLEAIRERQEAVKELVDNFILRQKVEGFLKKVKDLERLAGRVAYGTAGGRELQALRHSLEVVTPLKEALKEAKAPLLKDVTKELDAIPEITDLIARALVEEPPAGVKEGGLIRPGYHPEVDRLREAITHGREWIAELENEERERTGIKSLKVGFNRVFGYYIEVTRPNLSLVPADYERKQTLANAERFITPRLKELEQQVLGAEERLVELEYELFQELRSQVLAVLPRIQATAKALGVLDALYSLASVAAEYNYTCPVVDEGEVIEIRQGRHPMLERVGEGGNFVPNDTFLDCGRQRLHIITGPNMAGKSTYIRQVALIVLLAQVGSFVPASWARIGLVDGIFTRVGAADDLFAGQSTFMVEMREVAYILSRATRRSLIILDEVGRGTSTTDGLSIARAVVEYIHDRIGARTLFATHYHELVELEQYLPGVKNYSVAVREQGKDILFLHTIIPGGTDKSYGIHVARLAGLPEDLIRRAEELLKGIYQEGEKGSGKKVQEGLQEDYRILLRAQGEVLEPEPVTRSPEEQPPKSRRTAIEAEVLKELENYNLFNKTPLEAMQAIFNWQKKLAARKKVVRDEQQLRWWG
ncbi:DNA mismatch repair protein MutS [Thermanaeromonas toyohensis ToBE]|uniref:DNA mismatch repair protein MutS n=1 Tax=Thermanaeromonas toyohensis ToBE TaxID=698762 RepID=A0A1W1VW52_9FIRM|nr:DNA mismatch repair protein MutS [Thermanaeromonas toyohensis]SMB97599.1 DNA mismatch repair protein MutS [Thermanaeromonas toyohensis ToBE]